MKSFEAFAKMLIYKLKLWCSRLLWHVFKSSLSFHLVFPPPSEFPAIANEAERTDYKRQFDRDHKEYKDLQAELDALNKNLSDVDKELDELQEGSPQFLVRARSNTRVLFIDSPIFIFVHMI